jgi:hypothetical protein
MGSMGPGQFMRGRSGQHADDRVGHADDRVGHADDRVGHADDRIRARTSDPCSDDRIHARKSDPHADDRVRVGTMRLVLASAAWVYSAAESGMKPTVPFFIWMRNQLPVIPVTRTNLRRCTWATTVALSCGAS